MDPKDVVEDLLHPDTQVHDDGRVDLTAAAIEDVVEPGRIDFGEGELADATTAPHESHLRNPDDDYEWWTLREGQYRCTFNESLAANGRPVVVQPRDELLVRGATLPTVRTDTLHALPIAVGGAGLHLKANARVATVVDVTE